jgi:hypothetical protein
LETSAWLLLSRKTKDFPHLETQSEKLNLLVAKSVIKSGLVASVLLVNAAFAVNVEWTGAADFDTSSLTVDAIKASHLKVIASDLYVACGGLCTAEYHSHDGSASVGMLDLELDGIWTKVYIGTTFSEFHVHGLEVDFGTALVTGLEWTTTP